MFIHVHPKKLTPEEKKLSDRRTEWLRNHLKAGLEAQPSPDLLKEWQGKVPNWLLKPPDEGNL